MHKNGTYTNLQRLCLPHEILLNPVNQAAESLPNTHLINSSLPVRVD